MDEIYYGFMNYFENDDKEGAVNFVLKLLQRNEISIPVLYENILTPALNNMFCKVDETHAECVWREHIRSSIIRSIIECSYPFVMKELKRTCYAQNQTVQEKVLVLCPAEEYHELGARMVTDFFTLCGCNAVYIGANTPKNDFIEAVNVFEPQYIAMSITEYYNLSAAKDAISELRSKISNNVKIVVGGNAFKHNPDAYRVLDADKLVNCFKDIKEFLEVNRA